MYVWGCGGRSWEHGNAFACGAVLSQLRDEKSGRHNIIRKVVGMNSTESVLLNLQVSLSLHSCPRQRFSDQHVCRLANHVLKNTGKNQQQTHVTGGSFPGRGRPLPVPARSCRRRPRPLGRGRRRRTPPLGRPSSRIAHANSKFAHAISGVHAGMRKCRHARFC